MIPILVMAAAAVLQSEPGAPPAVVVVAPKSTGADATIEVDQENGGNQYGAIWAESAYARRAGGEVTLSCRVNAVGLAHACAVASEFPPNLGLGLAALQLQPSFKLPPPAGAIGPASVTMKITVRFDPPNDQLGAGSSLDAPGAQFSPGSSAPVEYSNAGSAVDRRGNPIVMRPVTMMSNPIWLSAPGFEDVRKAYPVGAGSIEGFAVLRCQVERAGGLSRCDVTKETPEARGFGKAAVALAPLFRVSPEVVAKAPHGAVIQVVVPVRFAPPDVAARRTVTDPLWISGFDPDAAPHVFPPEAVAQGMTSGDGVVRCEVGSDGSLTNCVPEKAVPEGVGFSEAAVSLARTMKMNLWSGDAGPVRGGVVRVPIRLNLQPSS